MGLFLRKYLTIFAIVLGGSLSSYGQWQVVGGQRSKGVDVWVSDDGKSSILLLTYRHDGKFIASDNKLQLEYIKSIIDNNKSNSGFRIWVDSYINKAGMNGALCRKEALALSNVFKSYAIKHWGLREGDFSTQNFSGTYNGRQGVTVVTLGELYPYDYIDARQSLVLGDLLVSEPSVVALERERVVVNETLDGKELGVVVSDVSASNTTDGAADDTTDGAVDGTTDDIGALVDDMIARDTTILPDILRQIELAPKVGGDNKFYSAVSGAGRSLPLAASNISSGRPSGTSVGSKSPYFTLNRFLLPLNTTPLNPYGLRISGGGTLSASSMYGINIPGLLPSMEPISQSGKGTTWSGGRADDGLTPRSSLYTITAPVYGGALSATPSSSMGATTGHIDISNAPRPSILTYNTSGPSLSSTTPTTTTAPSSTSAAIDMSGQNFTTISGKRIRGGKDDIATTATGSVVVTGMDTGSAVGGVIGAGSMSAQQRAFEQQQREARLIEASSRQSQASKPRTTHSYDAATVDEQNGRFPIMGVGINALAALTTTVSGQVDFYFHNHLSLGIEGAYNHWNVFGESYRTGISMGSAEFRYWFGKKKRFTGFYLGAYGSFGEFNFRFGSNDGTQSSFYSVGLTAGYVLRLGKQSNFYADFGLGGGFVHQSGVDYKYVNGDNIFKQSFIQTGIVPTKAKITFMYRIFNKPKGGLY